MKLRIELDIEPHEIELATELVNTLRQFIPRRNAKLGLSTLKGPLSWHLQLIEAFMQWISSFLQLCMP